MQHDHQQVIAALSKKHEHKTLDTIFWDIKQLCNELSQPLVKLVIPPEQLASDNDAAPRQQTLNRALAQESISKETQVTGQEPGAIKSNMEP
jgi:hypothetical protein